MKNRETCRDAQLFQEWRVQLYKSLGFRRETLLELLDSLSSNQQATSVVELSLNPLFRRDYNSLYKGIQEFLPQPTSEKYEAQVNLLLEAVSLTIPTSKSRHFIPETNERKTSGHPRWYGDKFDLKNEETWHEPDEVIQSSFTTKKGRQLTVTISGWKQMLMTGTSNYQMNRHPFTLLQITVRDEIGNAVWKPMWLMVIGSRREELSLIDCYESYRQRYDLEHLFRFGKQKLLMTAYATPDVNHEEKRKKLSKKS